MLTLRPVWIWCTTERARSSVAEHVTFNHGVAGSIPAGPTNFVKKIILATSVVVLYGAPATQYM